MTAEEQAVINALGIFKRQADDCVTCLYAYLTIHAVAGRSKPIRDHVNTNALFWNTALRALQSDLFLALGRVFEKKSRHNVNTFMRVIQAHRTAFSRAALKQRKAPIFAHDAAGLRDYMKGHRMPSPADIRRVTDVLNKYRAAYQAKYAAIRHQVFAHSVVVNRTQVQALFSKTNVRELQRMTIYLGRLHDAFWEAFNNGGRLAVRRRRHSVVSMLKRPKGTAVVKPIHEDVVSATDAALQPWTMPAVVHYRRPRR
jgi:hypothetical protein